MTREEREDAIDIIQSILNKYEEDECLVTEITIGDEDIKAFRMAIEALEQEPTTEENLAVDLIDRAELLKAMNTWDKFGYTARYRLERLDKDDKGFVPYVKYDDMVNCVKGMPSVTSIRPKGYWKLVQRGKFIDVCCSNCEAVRIKAYAYNYTIYELNKEDIDECFGSAEMRFCPNCGADMSEYKE